MNVIKDGVVGCDPDRWVSCSWAFKGMCHLYVYAFQVLGYFKLRLSSYAACRLFIMVFGSK